MKTKITRLLMASALLSGIGISAAVAQGFGGPSKITMDVAEALANDPLIPTNRIFVSDGGGVVTLTGTVASPQIRERANRIARQFHSVVDVNNDIVVQPGNSRRRR